MLGEQWISMGLSGKLTERLTDFALTGGNLH
jgi:hypothetical protein